MTEPLEILQNPNATPRDIAAALMAEMLHAMPPAPAPVQQLLTQTITAMTSGNDAAFPALPENLTAEDRQMLADRLAKLGHMHQLAGLAARDQAMGKDTPEIDALLTTSSKRLRFVTARDATEALNKPALEMTLTAHPTNTNAIAAMQSLRKISMALDGVRSGAPLSTVRQALHAFASTSLLPAQKLSVTDEINTMLYTLGNIYDDLPRTYAPFDAKLKEKYPDYAPDALQLNLHLHSWGSSGDKDGNQNVSADTTLLAIALHKQFILTRYADAFGKLGDTATESTLREALNGVKTSIAQLTQKQQQAGNNFFLSDGEFKQISAQLQSATSAIRTDTLMSAAATLYHRGAGEAKDEALQLMRRIRVFGVHGGKIEYRETSEEIERIATLIDPNASASALMHDPNIAHKVSALTLENAAKTPYSASDARPIAYHTLKRFELARDFPEMIEKQVLAECKGKDNMFQAVALQRAVSTPEKPVALGIVPLFEETETLSQAPGMLKAAIHDSAYSAHLDAVAKLHQQPRHQQVQIAHSDNARRAGMPAARIFINKVHRDIRAALKHSGVALQFYEGGSQSDIYRGGSRPITEMIDTFELHDFTKFTSQGGDLLNYFNDPSAASRFLSSTLAHNATPQSPEMRAARHAKDGAVEKAMSDSYIDYARFFETPGFGYFMRDIGYNITSTAGNFSSRAGARGGSEVVDVTKMRTIGFSETLQHAGITPTWLGARKLERALAGGSAKTMHSMYGQSAALKDVVDRMALGLARSDMQAIERVTFKDNAGNKIYPADPRSGVAGSLRARDEIYDEYRSAARLVIKALSGKEPGIDTATASFDTIRHTMLELVPHVQASFHDQTALTRTVQSLGAVTPPGETTTLSLLHNAADTVHHGRVPTLDDSAYRARHMPAQGGEILR
jgi:phosphoenolpyruvate carboxylase